jgi:hypothetical protein
LALAGIKTQPPQKINNLPASIWQHLAVAGIGKQLVPILAQIECSVLAIKPPGFTTPVALED